MLEHNESLVDKYKEKSIRRKDIDYILIFILIIIVLIIIKNLK